MSILGSRWLSAEDISDFGTSSHRFSSPPLSPKGLASLSRHPSNPLLRRSPSNPGLAALPARSNSPISLIYQPGSPSPSLDGSTVAPSATSHESEDQEDFYERNACACHSRLAHAGRVVLSEEDYRD
ncbi:hypothetical protein HDV00_010332 [Rhizophlyctis rosea]|nr:hypothetical protein HDV00_010332 [Rhizophlyctis rosea]